VSTENVELRERLGIRSEIVGRSAAIRQVENEISGSCQQRDRADPRESGVGKELVARAVHNNSPRRDNVFVCLNCAALSSELLASELFGHERGAFTGATERKIGKFEAAHKGAIMLDEIGEMSPGIQAKFLRVLEGHPFERVGGKQAIKVDVRVIAAQTATSNATWPRAASVAICLSPSRVGNSRAGSTKATRRHTDPGRLLPREVQGGNGAQNPRLYRPR